MPTPSTRTEGGATRRPLSAVQRLVLDELAPLPHDAIGLNRYALEAAIERKHPDHDPSIPPRRRLPLTRTLESLQARGLIARHPIYLSHFVITGAGRDARR